MKEIQPDLQLKYNEYVRIWSDLISEFYSKIIMDSEMEKYSENDPIFLTNLSVLIVTFAMDTLRKSSKIQKKIIIDLEKDIALSFSKQVFLGNNDELYENWATFYVKHSEFYSRLLNKKEKNLKEPTFIIINFAKMLLNVNDDKNENEVKDVQKLSMILIETINVFSRLASNSGVSVKLIGKPNFVVKKDSTS